MVCSDLSGIDHKNIASSLSNQDLITKVEVLEKEVIKDIKFTVGQLSK